MKQLRSLGYQSDLWILSLEGEIVEHPDVIQAITADNQDYYWGNFLVFPRPPEPGDEQRWTARFREVFSGYPGVRHIAFGWDDTSGDLGHFEQFVKEGFIIEQLCVMTTTAPTLCKPKQWNKDLVVRPLQTDQEWEDATALQIACGVDGIPTEEFAPFKRKQMRWYRKLSEDGVGHWVGAFLGETLVGDLGLYHGDGFGRFQSVETAPEYRRQGVASTLVYEASRLAFSTHPGHTLVIVADTGAPAMKMYEGVGYQTTEQQVAIFKRPTQA